jgi:crossover junction endodeoxyribonuclease RuvC
MKSVGLDVSTYVGMSIVGDGEDRGKVIHFPKRRGFQRLHLIAAEVQRTLEIWGPDLVVIEGYAYGNKGSLVTLVEVGTVVRVVLYDLKLPWFEVPPTSLKLWVTGSGVAKKERMAESVKERWNYSSWSNDIVDAYGLAQMGQVAATGSQKLLDIKGVVRGV